MTFLKLIDLTELLERFDSGERAEFYSRMASFIEKKVGKLKVEIEYPKFRVQNNRLEIKEQDAIRRVIKQMK